MVKQYLDHIIVWITEIEDNPVIMCNYSELKYQDLEALELNDCYGHGIPLLSQNPLHRKEIITDRHTDRQTGRQTDVIDW